MAKAKKLPSGSWRVLVYDYTDDNGKRHYQSFTSDDPSPKGKKKVELLAAEFALTKERNNRLEKMTLYRAIDHYIETKSGVLSPSTIRTYKSARRMHFESIGDILLEDLNNSIIQSWISILSKRLQPKTVHNTYGLLVAVLDMVAPDIRIKVKLPQKKDPRFYTPSDDDIKSLIRHIEESGEIELEIAVLLAAFGTLRRGEICALSSDDINGDFITVNKALVRNEQNEWEKKEPKTLSSNRVIELPKFVIKKMQGIKGRIITMSPDILSEHFRRAVLKSGLHKFRFHDLRHYSASILHALNVPDQYIMQRGGWATDHVMKAVYRNTIDNESAKQTQRILSHFEDMQHEMQHEN